MFCPLSALCNSNEKWDGGELPSWSVIFSIMAYIFMHLRMLYFGSSYHSSFGITTEVAFSFLKMCVSYTNTKPFLVSFSSQLEQLPHVCNYVLYALYNATSQEMSAFIRSHSPHTALARRTHSQKFVSHRHHNAGVKYQCLASRHVSRVSHILQTPTRRLSWKNHKSEACHALRANIRLCAITQFSLDLFFPIIHRNMSKNEAISLLQPHHDSDSWIGVLMNKTDGKICFQARTNKSPFDAWIRLTAFRDHLKDFLRLQRKSCYCVRLR